MVVNNQTSSWLKVFGIFYHDQTERSSKDFTIIVDKLKKRSRACEDIFRDARRRILQSAEEKARLAPANDDNEAG